MELKKYQFMNSLKKSEYFITYHLYKIVNTIKTTNIKFIVFIRLSTYIKINVFIENIELILCTKRSYFSVRIINYTDYLYQVRY